MTSTNAEKPIGGYRREVDIQKRSILCSQHYDGNRCILLLSCMFFAERVRGAAQSDAKARS